MSVRLVSRWVSQAHDALPSFAGYGEQRIVELVLVL